MHDNSFSLRLFLPNGNANDCIVCTSDEGKYSFIKVSKGIRTTLEAREEIYSFIRRYFPGNHLGFPGRYVIYGKSESLVGHVSPDTNLSLIDAVLDFIRENTKADFCHVIFYPNHYPSGISCAGRNTAYTSATMRAMLPAAPKTLLDNSLNEFIEILQDKELKYSSSNLLIVMEYPIGTIVKKLPKRPCHLPPKLYAGYPIGEVLLFIPAAVAFLRVGLRYLFWHELLDDTIIAFLCSEASCEKNQDDDSSPVRQ